MTRISSDGTWYQARGDVDAMNATDKKSGPMDPMGANVLGNMLGVMSYGELHMGPGDRFQITGFDGLEGHTTKKGNTIEFTVDRVGGLSKEDFKDAAKELRSDSALFTTFRGEKLPNGSISKLTFMAGPPIVFEPENIPISTINSVSSREAKVVGVWVANASKSELMQGLSDRTNPSCVELILRPSNQFELHVGISLYGTWSAEGDVLKLTPSGAYGKTLPAGKDMSSTLKIASSDDLLTPSDSDLTSFSLKRAT